MTNLAEAKLNTAVAKAEPIYDMIYAANIYLPIVRPKNTKLPRIPRPTLSKFISFLMFIVAAGRLPWSTLMRRFEMKTRTNMELRATRLY